MFRDKSPRERDTDIPDKCGPPCKHCGCNATKLIKPSTPDSWFPSGKAECLSCGKVFSFSDDALQGPGMRGDAQ
jgi:hypothetical protein